MAGLRVDITTRGLDGALKKMARLSRFDKTVLLDQLGQLVEMQTKRRIAHEKRSPDGAPWKPNLEGTSTLFREGFLQGSIHHVTGPASVRIGTGLVYAAIHQFGGTIVPKTAKRLAFTLRGKSVFAKKVTIPARPYLGVSTENKAEIERATALFVRGRLA